MEIQVKNFHQLTLDELYQVLQLRSEVFVVEQECIYQDIDGKDKDALHVLGIKNGEIIAYTRCFDKGFYFKEAAIGRIVVKKNQRKFGYGEDILRASVKAIEKTFNTAKIKLSAQQYLIKFYESNGFMPVGKGYLEDGIPHIAMLRNL